MAMNKLCSACGAIIPVSSTCGCKKKDVTKRVKRYYENNPDELKFLNSKAWKRKRMYIIRRDLGICQRCYHKFNKLNSKQLQVHHIKSRLDYPNLRLDDNNLITLCKTCNLELGTSNKLDFEMDH